MISRSHAKIVHDNSTGKVTIFDLNSTNGVYVNDTKIDVYQLSNGDVVTFGGRGKSIPIGTLDPQPDSEFIYEFEQEDGDEEESAFETAKSFTDNLQVIFTWITTAVLVGSYLFAEEGSEEFSYVATYVAPIFAFVGLPFNRLSFTLTFVIGVGILLAISVWLLKASKSNKGKGKKKL